MPSACLIRSVLENKHRYNVLDLLRPFSLRLNWSGFCIVIAAMRTMKSILAFAAAITLVLTTFATAADQKFRADGTVQRLSSDMILVRASAQDVEIARNAKTKVTGGEPRRGGAVTVFYTKVNGQNVATEIVMGGAKP